MTLRNSFPVVVRPKGVSDAIDGNNAFPGAMAAMTNLIPSPSTEDQWVPRPARDVLANLTTLAILGSPGLTQVSNHIVVGNVLYGMVSSSTGRDAPFAVSLPTGTILPVAGINFTNLPASPSVPGTTQKPLFAQVGARILVTHPGFAGGIYNPIGFTTTITANVHAGSNVIDGFFPTGGIFPGMSLTAASGNIPAGTFVFEVGAIDFNTLGQGVVNTTQLIVADAAGIVPGMTVSGGNGGIQGFVVSIAGFVVTMDRVLTTNFANALVSFHGVVVTMSSFATGETSGDTVTVASVANPANKFGWFDISGTNIFQANCTLNATTTALVPDVVGIQPGHLVTGTGIPAGTTVVDLVNPNIYVAGNPPVFGQTFLTLNYGQLAGDSPPFTFPIVGQTVVGLGLNQGTTVASVSVISQSTNAAQVQIGLSVAALGSSAGFGGAVPTYNLSGVQEVILSQAATISGAVGLTFTGGTPTAPLWGVGDTAINHLPSTPIGVGSFNGRAYFACGLNGIPFSDSLLPCVRTNARQALVPGNGLAVTHCVGQPLASPITGGIVQALYAFQGIGAVQQITGDPATNNLALNPLNIATGTLAPASIVPTTLGMAFVSPEGLRIIDFTGTISQPIGESGKGVAVPLINAVDPTRIVAAANGSVLRIALRVSSSLNPSTVEYWFDLVRKVWSGPHSHQTTAIAPWNDTFIINNELVQGQLYTSPVDTTGLTDYEEDGFTLTWSALTVLQPTHGEMCEYSIVESTLGMLLPSDKPVTVTAYDEAGAIIDQVQIPANYTNPLWGGNVTPNLWGTGRWYAVDGFFRQHPLPWKKPLVFKQVAFSISGTSRFGMALGSLELRMEKLGYLLQYQPEIPLVISVPPLPFTPGTATPPLQVIASIAPTSFAIVGGVGSAGELVGTFGATMMPAAPTFAGTWSISGPNANLFAINANTGQLSVGAADIVPGSYAITVTAAPIGIGIPPLAQTVTITVSASLPQMVAAIGPSAATFVGGSGSAGEAVAGFTATMTPSAPPFMGTWSISGANATLFTINAATGALAVAAADVAPGVYPLTVTATPFSATAFSLSVMLTATAPPQRIVAVGPTALNFATTTTGPVANFIATMSPVTPAFAGTWSVSGNAAFTINSSTGILSTTGIAAGAYGLTVTAAQAGVLNSPFAQAVVVTVTAAPPPPQVIVGVSPSSAGLTAGVGTAGTAVATFTATMSPPNPAFSGTWSLGGANASAFTLNATTGVLSVGSSNIAAGTYAITVTASQTGLTPFTQNVTVTANSPAQNIVGVSPTSISFVATTTPGPVATFTATMSPATPAFAGTWSVGGNANFTIAAQTGVLSTNSITAGSYSVTVIATQANATGSPFSQVVAVTVTASPPPPQAIVGVSPTSTGLVGGAGTAGAAITTFVATLSPSAPAFTGTWSLGGANASSFTLNANTGALSVGASNIAVGSYSITVTATQAGLTGSPFVQNVTVTASAPNPQQSIVGVSPTSLSFLSTATGVVATFAATMSPASPAFTGTWSVSGNAAFSINSSTGALSTTGVAAGSYGLTVTATQVGATNSPFAQSVAVTVSVPPPPPQAIVGISPSSAGLTAGSGTAGEVITTMTAVLNPTTPGFAGTWSLGGTNASLFTLGAANGVLSVGPANIAAGTYSVTVTATQAGLNGSPFTQNVSITASAPGGAIGYSAVVTLFGTATYNADGTVTGTPNGPVYTYNPDTPDSHTTPTNLGNFVSPFANFTQGCVHCVRDDTALRVWFRKDVSPDPTKIEIILDHGKYTGDGSGTNLGPFALQIFQGGVAQHIAVFTRAGAGNTWVPGGSAFTGYTQVGTVYFPQLGRWSRKRFWNNGGGTPFTGDPGFSLCRPVIRNGTQLLPANLNLVPNINFALGTSYGATGTNTAPAVPAYSSAWTDVAHGGTNYNPVGANENLGLAYIIGGVGGRPDLGIVNEWCAAWVAAGDPTMQLAMLVLAEADGGIPWHLRDAVTGWAPHSFDALPTYGWFWGLSGPQAAPYTGVDMPPVPVPSVAPAGWSPDLNHTSSISYVPYLVTGDPFYLENLQDKFNWIIGSNFFSRQSGYGFNSFDSLNFRRSAPFAKSMELDGSSSRGRGWHIRDMVQAYLATPASVPSWLLPQSYIKSIGDQNQSYLDTWRANTIASYPEMAWVGNVFPAGDADYGLYIWYEGIANGFMLNQGGSPFSNWTPWVTFRSQSIIALTAGLSGFDNRWTHQYGFWTFYFSNDYTATYGSKPTSYGDTWNFGANMAACDANTQYQQGWTVAPVAINRAGPPSAAGGIHAWTPSTAYHCNSWIAEFRGGVPVAPNVGDVASLTISGSFAGSPVTISHTITAGDVAALIALVGSDYIGGSHPVASDWITKINANPALAAAGITGTTRCDNLGTGAFQGAPGSGRIFIRFNSDGTSSLGGPVIGDIVVTGSLTTSTICSLYIQANGDAVYNGTSISPALYNRSLAYQAAKSLTSPTSGGPTGNALQTLVGDGTNTANWMFSPEMKSSPIEVPGGPTTAGQSGWGGIYGDAPTNPGYIYEAMAGLASLGRAGIANAGTGRANLQAMLNGWISREGNVGPGSSGIGWAFSIAP